MIKLPHMRNLPCLHCGDDLRGAIMPGVGEVCCPECGLTSPARDLNRSGFTAKSIVELSIVVAGPAIALLLSVWVFKAWSGESLHALLCMLLAPAVIAAHAFAAWEATGHILVLKRSSMRRLRISVVVVSCVVDLAACVVVMLWFV